MWQLPRFVHVLLATVLIAAGAVQASDEVLQKAKSTFADLKKKQDAQIDEAYEKAISDATKAAEVRQYVTAVWWRGLDTSIGLRLTFN